MLDFRIDTFLEVCRLMNYTRAAEQLNLTQPAVSQHIRWLEEQCGVKLFHYENKQLNLTAAGQMLRSAAITMKQDQMFLYRRMQEADSEDADLCFGVTPTVGMYLIPKPLAAYRRRHPSAKVSMQVENSELLCRWLDSGEIDFAILGRQMLADPEFANKAKRGHEDQIRRCLRCYKCFPGSPEEGYDDLPFTSEELALYVGHCTINPLAHLPFDPDTLAPASKQETVLIVGGGAAGMQAAITACDRGQKVILAEQGPRLGGLLRFTDVDTDKPDLMNFKNLLVREVERRDIDVRLNTVITPENITSFGADGVIFATGSLPSCPPVPGIGHAHKAMDMYDGKVKPGHKIVMVGGGLVGCEAGLFLQKTGHEVTVVELLGRLANESFGMYREALIWEMEKCGMAMLPKTRCLEITPTGVKVENAGGVQTLEADTVLFALGMKSVDIAPLKAAAEAAGLKTWVIGDAIQPGKVDQATRSAYLAGIEVGR